MIGSRCWVFGCFCVALLGCEGGADFADLDAYMSEVHLQSPGRLIRLRSCAPTPRSPMAPARCAAHFSHPKESSRSLLDRALVLSGPIRGGSGNILRASISSSCKWSGLCPVPPAALRCCAAQAVSFPCRSVITWGETRVGSWPSASPAWTWWKLSPMEREPGRSGREHCL